MPPSRVRIPPSPLPPAERCPSGLRSATGNRVRAERCVAGSNPALSATFPFTPLGGGNKGGCAENELAGSPLIPRHLKPVCGYRRRVSLFLGLGSAGAADQRLGLRATRRGEARRERAR